MKETVEQIRERVQQAQRNYNMNTGLLEDILLRERGYVTRIPKNEDVIVLYSGGLDSTIMLDMIIKEWNVRVHPLYIRRRARAEKHEEKAVDYFYSYFKKKYSGHLGELTKIDYEVPPKKFKKYFPKELAATQGHPLRNSTLQNLGVMYAASLNGKYGLNIKTVLSGSVGEDSTEPELGLLSLRSQTLNTCIQLADWEWQITSPLTDLAIRDKPVYKTELIKYAIANHIPVDKTRSCFSSSQYADGTCFACKKRLKAFEDAGVKDPALYKHNPYKASEYKQSKQR